MNKLLPKRLTSSNAKGFTIIELLVATAIFSVILLVLTMGVLQISRVYYKGLTETNTQNAARTIMDTIAQSIQFNGGVVTETPAPGTAYSTTGDEYGICVGDMRFTYVIGYELEDNSPQESLQQKKNVMVTDEYGGCNSGNPGPLPQLESIDFSSPTEPRELLGPNMRLTNFRVNRIGGADSPLYKITVRVVYGDSDLLTDPTAEDARCKDERFGTQFCAISEISTVVTKRVE